MKKIIALFSVILLLAFVSHSKVYAQTSKEKSDKVSLTGEVLDMDCYMSMGSHGADHKECGTKCVANGNPMGIMTKDGKVYVITAGHDNLDPYNTLKKHVSETVTVTGEVHERNGIKSIEVSDVKVGS